MWFFWLCPKVCQGVRGFVRTTILRSLHIFVFFLFVHFDKLLPFFYVWLIYIKNFSNFCTPSTLGIFCFNHQFKVSLMLAFSFILNQRLFQLLISMKVFFTACNHTSKIPSVWNKWQSFCDEGKEEKKDSNLIMSDFLLYYFLLLLLTYLKYNKIHHILTYTLSSLTLPSPF